MMGTTDPFLVRVTLEWLTQYARFLRQSPALVDQLGKRFEEFELIPVPKMLLNGLAVPGLIGSGTLGQVDIDIQRWLAHTPSRVSEPVSSELDTAIEQRVRSFLSSISDGDMECVSACLAPAYLDEDGRGACELKAELQQLLSTSHGRAFEFHSTQCISRLERNASVRVTGLWTTRAGQKLLQEIVILDFELDQTVEGTWKIRRVTGR